MNTETGKTPVLALTDILTKTSFYWRLKVSCLRKRRQESNNISETVGVVARDPARCRVESWHSSSTERSVISLLSNHLPTISAAFPENLNRIAAEGKPNGWLALRILAKYLALRDFVEPNEVGERPPLRLWSL